MLPITSDFTWRANDNVIKELQRLINFNPGKCIVILSNILLS
jgi:hypothetical protein